MENAEIQSRALFGIVYALLISLQESGHLQDQRFLHHLQGSMDSAKAQGWTEVAELLQGQQTAISQLLASAAKLHKKP